MIMTPAARRRAVRTMLRGRHGDVQRRRLVVQHDTAGRLWIGTASGLVTTPDAAELLHAATGQDLTPGLYVWDRQRIVPDKRGPEITPDGIDETVAGIDEQVLVEFATYGSLSGRLVIETPRRRLVVCRRSDDRDVLIDAVLLDGIEAALRSAEPTMMQAADNPLGCVHLASGDPSYAGVVMPVRY